MSADTLQSLIDLRENSDLNRIRRCFENQLDYIFFFSYAFLKKYLSQKVARIDIRDDSKRRENMKRYFIGLLCFCSILSQASALDIPHIQNPTIGRARPLQSAKNQAAKKPKAILKSPFKRVGRITKKKQVRRLPRTRKIENRGNAVKSRSKAQARAQRFASQELAEFKKTQQSKEHKELIKKGEREAKEVLQKDIFSKFGRWM